MCAILDWARVLERKSITHVVTWLRFSRLEGSPRGISTRTSRHAQWLGNAVVRPEPLQHLIVTKARRRLRLLRGQRRMVRRTGRHSRQSRKFALLRSQTQIVRTVPRYRPAAPETESLLSFRPGTVLRQRHAATRITDRLLARAILALKGQRLALCIFWG